MNLQGLLGDLPKQQFVREHFQRLPFSRTSAAKEICELGTWPVWDHLLRDPEADVMIVRDGEQFPARRPDNGHEGAALLAEGFTLLVRHAEKHQAGLQAFAAEFVRDFRAPVNVHLYATPPGRHGFSWHYDCEDVFILQTGGAKEYSLRKNTVHPWPLEETIPQDMRYGREIMPLMRVLLAVGDWLYIPCGYWHKAECPPGNEPALSIALGVMQPAAISVLDRLRTRLVSDLLWRQRLPVCGEARGYTEEQLLAQHHELIEQLAKDLHRKLADETFVRELLGDEPT
jgi:50S ribosomal protein L16 3-hydroxylase